MKNISKWIAVAAILGTFASIAQAATVTVFAAASLKEAMDEQARLFEAKTSPAGSDKVVVSYAGSNTLAKQIEAGAPADLFISADLDWMDYLDKRHLLLSGTRGDLLRNTLVLIAPAASQTNLKIAPGFALAAALGNDKLALANSWRWRIPTAFPPASTPRARWKRWVFGLAWKSRSRARKTCALRWPWSRAVKRRSAWSTARMPFPTKACVLSIPFLRTRIRRLCTPRLWSPPRNPSLPNPSWNTCGPALRPRYGGNTVLRSRNSPCKV
jgi:hypothetical protein